MIRIFLVAVVFVVMTALHYFAERFGELPELSTVFITISTFLFAILVGFFIARQGQRYSDIKKNISTFDGHMSALYRSVIIFGSPAQQEVADVLRKHYTAILKHQAWDWHLTHKSSTITTLGVIIRTHAKKTQWPSFAHNSILSMIERIGELQIERKKMAAIRVERIPFIEWIIIYILALILIGSLLLHAPDTSFILSSFKGFFSTIIIFLVIVLHELDTLKLFETTIGGASAQDVLNILDKKR